jgi:hypothetical protein
VDRHLLSKWKEEAIMYHNNVARISGGLTCAIVLLCSCGGDTPVQISDRSCTYKGEVYQDQEEFKDDCNSCKCNPEGIAGVGCTQMACPATCGDQTCDAGLVCVNPCCGGAPPECFEKPDDGVCPAGTHDGCTWWPGSADPEGCEADPCTPDPPYCADPEEIPEGCTLGADGHAVCLCA